MKYKYYDKYINKKTKGRYDVTPLFENPKSFSNLISDLLKPFKKEKFNKVAGLDALGFIIGGALSQKARVGFVTVRKLGKLPGVKGTVIKTKFKDYTKTNKGLEISKTAIKKGDKVLIVDEWIETGSQLKGTIKLIEKLGGKVIGITALVAHKSKNTKILFDKYNCKAIKVNNEI
ncbi:MAG: adenine phosphoribosyltransferase [Nanoarchaeota archaeon]|nr:adenine phosphoribosyltransferase [Nanoarchaeota archaeon]MCG2717444.1 adenine phosphoribosyltransferase [Nanoarchaeota archaeon]